MTESTTLPTRPASPRLTAEQRDHLPGLIDQFEKTASFIKNVAFNPDPGSKAITRAMVSFEQIETEAARRFGNKGASAMAIGLDLSEATQRSLMTKSANVAISANSDQGNIPAETAAQKKIRKDILSLVRKHEKLENFSARDASTLFHTTLALTKKFEEQPIEWRTRCAAFSADSLKRLEYFSCRERAREFFLGSNSSDNIAPKPRILNKAELQDKFQAIADIDKQVNKDPQSLTYDKAKTYLNNALTIFYQYNRGEKPADWDSSHADRFRNWYFDSNDGIRSSQLLIGQALAKLDQLDMHAETHAKELIAEHTPKLEKPKNKKANTKSITPDAIKSVAAQATLPDQTGQVLDLTHELARLDLHTRPDPNRIPARTMEDIYKTLQRPQLRRLQSAPGRLPDWKSLPRPD